MSKYAHTYNEEVSGMKNENSKNMLFVRASSWNTMLEYSQLLEDVSDHK